MITNEQIFEKTNNLLMEAVKMNYDIHRLIGAVLEVKKENLNNTYFDTDTLAKKRSIPNMTRAEAKAVLNSAYGLVGSKPKAPAYWNLEPDIPYEGKLQADLENRVNYYHDYLGSELMGILPADCDIQLVLEEDLKKLITYILNKTLGFAPSPDKIEFDSISHTPYMNLLVFTIFNSRYRLEITKTNIDLLIEAPELESDPDDCNAILFEFLEYPEYDESEAYGNDLY